MNNPTPEQLENMKQIFLDGCERYSKMGTHAVILSQDVAHPQFAKTPLPNDLRKVLDQYYHLGHNLAALGKALDELGGESCMGDPSFPKPRMPRDEPPKDEPTTGPEQPENKEPKKKAPAKKKAAAKKPKSTPKDMEHG